MAGRYGTAPCAEGLIVTGGLAGAQLIITVALAVLAISNLGAPVSSFGTAAPAGQLPAAAGQTSLLYICGSLPPFLGGEVGRPAVTVRRGLLVAYLVSAAVITCAVLPLAAESGAARAPVRGMTIAQEFAGHGFAVVVGVGVAVSIAGVMLAEFLALSRLGRALTSRSQRAVTGALSAALVETAPITLINPERVYEDLIKPSLVALWLSQLIVFAVYPRYAARRQRRLVPACALAAIASAVALYGLWATYPPAS